MARQVLPAVPQGGLGGVEDQAEVYTGVSAVHHLTMRNNLFWKARAGAFVLC